jgi:hypothetical protein
MSAGDAQRVWFPEMLAELKRSWSRAMTWEQLADLCRRMTVKRRSIRQGEGIKPPRRRCPTCGQVSGSDIAGISFRSALFALKNSGVVTAAEFQELDRSWKRHRTAQGLDPYGQKVQRLCPRADNEGPCP